MDDFDVKPILESLFFVSDSPIRLESLVEILPESSKEAILEGIRQIQAEYGDHSKGIELTEIAGGYQFRTKPDWADWVNWSRSDRPSARVTGSLKDVGLEIRPPTVIEVISLG